MLVINSIDKFIEALRSGLVMDEDRIFFKPEFENDGTISLVKCNTQASEKLLNSITFDEHDYICFDKFCFNGKNIFDLYYHIDGKNIEKIIPYIIEINFIHRKVVPPTSKTYAREIVNKFVEFVDDETYFDDVEQFGIEMVDTMLTIHFDDSTSMQDIQEAAKVKDYDNLVLLQLDGQDSHSVSACSQETYENLREMFFKEFNK